MTTTPTPLPYDWLKSIEPHIVDKRRLAMVEIPEEFSWNGLAHAFAQHFEVPRFELHPGLPTWVDAETAVKGLQAPIVSLHYAVGEFPGDAYWIAGSESTTQLMADLLSGQPGLLASTDPVFLEAFLHYVAAETLQLLSPLGFRQSLAPRTLGHDSPPAQGKWLSIDLQIGLFNASYPTRLLISEPLAAAWKEHFMRLGRRQELSEAVANQTQIVAHLESGRVSLSQQEWAALAEGDLLVLDSSTVTPGVEKGRVMLTVSGVPLFRCMLKAGQIKILEHPLYHEVETAMSETEDDEISAHRDDEDFDEASEVEEDEELDLEEEEFEETETEEGHAEPNGATPEPSTERALTPAERISLTIVIEVGRIKMSLSKLRDLQPGQLLELDVKPEEGVDLVINGACVGRGELLRVGETLGVRVLELG